MKCGWQPVVIAPDDAVYAWCTSERMKGGASRACPSRMPLPPTLRWDAVHTFVHLDGAIANVQQGYIDGLCTDQHVFPVGAVVCTVPYYPGRCFGKEMSDSLARPDWQLFKDELQRHADHIRTVFAASTCAEVSQLPVTTMGAMSWHMFHPAAAAFGAFFIRSSVSVQLQFVMTEVRVRARHLVVEDTRTDMIYNNLFQLLNHGRTLSNR